MVLCKVESWLDRRYGTVEDGEAKCGHIREEAELLLAVGAVARQTENDIAGWESGSCQIPKLNPRSALVVSNICPMHMRCPEFRRL